MFKIIETKLSNGLDYVIKNKNLIIFLYNMDWNGEIYTKGYYHDGTQRKDYSYEPIYKEIGEDEFKIIGFKEI